MTGPYILKIPRETSFPSHSRGEFTVNSDSCKSFQTDPPPSSEPSGSRNSLRLGLFGNKCCSDGDKVILKIQSCFDQE